MAQDGIRWNSTTGKWELKKDDSGWMDLNNSKCPICGEWVNNMRYHMEKMDDDAHVVHSIMDS